MGCVSSNLLSHEDEFTQLGSSALSHHIVSLTSSTYGLLTLDPPPSRAAASTTPPTLHLRFAAPGPEKTASLGPLPESKSLWSEPKPIRPGPEVINSWELMAGLDADSFRFFPSSADKENSNPNRVSKPPRCGDGGVSKLLKSPKKTLSDHFEKISPPQAATGGDGDRVVMYTTSLRGVRKTFEDCNVVRAAIEGFGILICERDVSMDRGFREELRELMKGINGKAAAEEEETESIAVALPQVFVRGRHVGGAEEVLRFAEEGLLGEILQGLPKKKAGTVCEGCGDVRFLPCFECSGSCKVVMSRTVVMRCTDCNENGLVLCPICS